MSNIETRPVDGALDAAKPVPRIKAVAWVFALLWILALELALRAGLPLPLPDNYRTPDRKSAGVDVMVSHLKRADGPRVAMVGDSIAWGMYAQRDEATGAQLSRLLREHFDERTQVGNFGLISAHPNDYLPIIVDLVEQDAVDTIVIQFDARFYSDKHPRSYRYPELYDQIDGGDRSDDIAKAAPPAVKLGRSIPSAKEIDRVLSSLSMVWRLRLYPFTALVDARSGANAVREGLHEFDNGPRVYAKKRSENLPLPRIKADYDIPPYSADNAYFRDLALAFDFARSKGVSVVLYAGPVDGEMLGDLDLWDAEQYAERIAFVERFVERHGGRFVDLTNAVPADSLGDTHHPLPDGYRIIAESIAPAVEQALAESGGAK